jgi:cytosine/adenosine deaminase-related metal-dependent hydrolase
MPTLLIKNGVILTLDAASQIFERGHILIEDGLIATVAPGDFPGHADHTIDATLRLVAPGLINAHTHSQSATMAGIGDGLRHPAFMWLTQAHTSRRTPAEIRLAVHLTAWAMLSTGTTAAIDHFPGQRFTAADLDAVLAAWDETGMRIALGMRFFDAGFADIGATGDHPLLQPQGLAELRDLMAGAVHRWHNHNRLQVWPAPSNPDRCSDDALLFCADLAERHDLGIHTHLLETETQARQAIDRFGMTSVARLARLGVLSNRWSCAHCLWLTDEDRALMAAAGATAVLNPESNAKLGSGTPDPLGLRRAGVNLALGTDGAGANDNQVMHEAMRTLAGIGRLSAPDALATATTGGATALRIPTLGRLTPGAPADLVLYRLDRPGWIPLNNPISQLVWAETGAAVDTVLIAGEIVFTQNRPTRFTVDTLPTTITAMSHHLHLRNADLFTAAAEKTKS